MKIRTPRKNNWKRIHSNLHILHWRAENYRYTFHIVQFQLLQLMHKDIADIFPRSPVDPKYCLLAVRLFTSKIYTYLIKNRSLLKRKLAQLYKDLERKRKNLGTVIRIQTDQKFNQNETKKLNKNITQICSDCLREERVC